MTRANYPVSANNQFLFSGKEALEEYDGWGTKGKGSYDFGARIYYSPFGRFDIPDPLSEIDFSVSPYAYCRNNPVKYIDPKGLAPIYDPQGNLIGTDDEGLQGAAIIMNMDNFKQGMSNKDAMKYDLGLDKLANQGAVDRYTASYEGLKDRPDWDGYLTGLPN